MGERKIHDELHTNNANTFLEIVVCVFFSFQFLFTVPLDGAFVQGSQRRECVCTCVRVTTPVYNKRGGFRRNASKDQRIGSCTDSITGRVHNAEV